MSELEETRALLSARHRRAVAFVTENTLKPGKAWSSLTYAYDYTEGTMLYLVWFDDSKKAIEAKIIDAIATYKLRYGIFPNVALVSEADQAPASVAGVRTQVEKRISRNNIHVGYEA